MIWRLRALLPFKRMIWCLRSQGRVGRTTKGFPGSQKSAGRANPETPSGWHVAKSCHGCDRHPGESPPSPPREAKGALRVRLPPRRNHPHTRDDDRPLPCDRENLHILNPQTLKTPDHEALHPKAPLSEARFCLTPSQMPSASRAQRGPSERGRASPRLQARGRAGPLRWRGPCSGSAAPWGPRTGPSWRAPSGRRSRPQL